MIVPSSKFILSDSHLSPMTSDSRPRPRRRPRMDAPKNGAESPRRSLPIHMAARLAPREDMLDSDMSRKMGLMSSLVNKLASRTHVNTDS